jgi:hypothetical protein
MLNGDENVLIASTPSHSRRRNLSDSLLKVFPEGPAPLWTPRFVKRELSKRAPLL